MSHPNQISIYAIMPSRKPPCWQTQEQNSLFSQLVFISDATVMTALGTSSGTSAVANIAAHNQCEARKSPELFSSTEQQVL